MTTAANATTSSLRPLLAKGLTQLQLPLADAQQLKLLAYIALLEKWNRVYNLTAIREPERMVGLHIFDCVSVLPYLASAKTMIDVGTGAGLPGIPLAIARPELKITLLDTVSKKTTFVRQTVAELALTNVDVVTERVEQFTSDEGFDVVISRAFAELKDFAECSAHLCAANGVMMAMKGVYPHDEISRLPDDFYVKGAVTLDVPEVDGQRHLIIIRKK